MIGVSLTLGAALCGSVGYVAIKRGLEGLDYQTFIFLGLFMGAALSATLLWSSGGGLAGLSARAALPFVTTGLLGGGLLGRIADTKAVDELGAARTHALISASPLVTVLMEVGLGRETVGVRLSAGTLIVVAGASLLSYLAYQEDSGRSQKGQGRAVVGLGFALYALVMFGLQPVLRGIGLDLGAEPLQGAFIRFSTGFCLYSAYLLASRTSVQLRSGRRLSYYLVAGAGWALAPLLSIYALRSVSPTVFASLMRTGPLFTVVLTYLFLEGIEEVNPRIVVSALLIVVGAFLVSTV